MTATPPPGMPFNPSSPTPRVPAGDESGDGWVISPDVAGLLLGSPASTLLTATLDRCGRIRRANPRLAEALGRSPGALAGLDGRRLLADEGWPIGRRLRRHVAAALASGGWWTGVLPLRTAADAVRWFELLLVDRPGSPDVPRGVAAIGREVSDARLAAGERAGLRRALDAAFEDQLRLHAELGLAVAERHRLAASLVHARDCLRLAHDTRSGLLRSLGHAIRMPLASLVSRADLLVSDSHRTIPEESRRRLLAMIQAHAESLATTVDDLLDRCREDEGPESGRISPNGLLCDAVAEVRLDPRSRGVRFDLRFGRQLPPEATVDRAAVRQLVHGLLLHECDRRGRGVVEVRVDGELAPDDRCTMTIRVIRAGRRLDAEELRSLQPTPPIDLLVHGRDDPAEDRLASLGRIARELGGDLQAERRTAACLALRIPIAAASDERVADAPLHPAPDSDRPLAGRRILVAEDFADHAILLEEILRRAGAEVVVVPDGAVAVRTLTEPLEATGPETATPPFDAVLLDMLMPVMDGYAAAQAIRHRGVDLPILAVTASAMIGAEKDCLAAGCTDYVPKPIDRELLIDRLTWALEPRRRAA